VTCAEKPLHQLTDRLEHVAHDALRGELSLLVALAEEELARRGSRNTALLQVFHLKASRLLEAVANHFRQEETRLFPAVRLAEDGLRPGRLGPLVLDMRREHTNIRARLDEIRDITDNVASMSASPLVEMLFVSLAAVADDLERHLDDEERTLFPDVVAAWFGTKDLAHAATTSA
jgi:iron-sulfur cluster repair protein YtfE (RIC family)